MPFPNPFKSPKVAPAPQPTADLDNCAKLVYDNVQLNELEQILQKKKCRKRKKGDSR